MSDFHDDSAATAIRDAAAATELDFDIRKCEVDPIKAQDDALLSIALKLREGKVAVNSVQIDEARTTMVRSNYAPDWSRANWSHPLMSNLKNLSSLSSSDFPSFTKRGLVDERKAIDRVARIGNGAEENAAVVVEEQTQPTKRGRVPAEVSDRLSLDAVRAEVADPDVIQRAIEHGVTAVIEVSPFVLAQKALLQLSSETINSDPQLLALVSAVAQSNKGDPIVAGRVAMGETPTIPVTVVAPSIRNMPSSSRRKATDALPSAFGNHGDMNRGFHASDIADYDHLKQDLSPDRNRNPKSMHEVPLSIERNNDSNHADDDGGYKTWCERHLDRPSQHEDMEKFQAYRETVTTLEGKCLAITSKYSVDGGKN